MRLFQLIDNTPQVLRREIKEEYCVDFIMRYETKHLLSFLLNICRLRKCVLTDRLPYSTASQILHAIFKPSLVSLRCVSHDIFHFVLCCKSLDVVRLFQLIDNTPQTFRVENQREILFAFAYACVCFQTVIPPRTLRLTNSKSKIKELSVNN